MSLALVHDLTGRPSSDGGQEIAECIDARIEKRTIVGEIDVGSVDNSEDVGPSWHQWAPHGLVKNQKLAVHLEIDVEMVLEARNVACETVGRKDNHALLLSTFGERLADGKSDLSLSDALRPQSSAELLEDDRHQVDLSV